ncbi:MAG: IPT/TIG domain-containing protein [Bryobacterales bacterium]
MICPRQSEASTCKDQRTIPFISLTRTLILFLCIGILESASAAPVVSAVVNGASFIQGSIAPGTIVSIFGTGLASKTTSASTLPLPNTLDGTSVSIAGQALPLFFVSPTQINAQMPFQVAAGPAQLLVKDSSGAVTSHTVTVAAGSPALFTSTSDGKGEAIAVHADFTPVKRASLEYALTGETIILFCTGLGLVENFNAAGVSGPSSPLAHTIIKPTIEMDGRPAQITFSGLAPGFVGLYQINVVVPPDVGGDVITTVRVGDAVSNQVTINVAGTYTLSENYAGIIGYKATGNQFALELSSFRSLSQGRDGGRYRLLNAGAVIDEGTFQIESTETVFLASGRSSVTSEAFVGVMDTLDAGRSFFGLLYDNDSLDKVQDANDWYAGFEVTTVVPQPPAATPPPVLPGVPASCSAVEGALIFADDGTFLGRITSNVFARDSIGNEFGPYGSEFSSTSIFNEFGKYGSEFSPTSAFNRFATRPPIIFVNETAVAYLTTNEFKTPRIDPRALFPCIGR